MSRRTIGGAFVTAAAAAALAGANTVAAAPVAIGVVSGKPSEFHFTLTKSKAFHGTVIFTIANKGALAHDFKVCRSPSTALANSCTGTGTKLISPGQSAKLTVVLSKPGKYEYLCTVTGHAAAGMKGWITVS